MEAKCAENVDVAMEDLYSESYALIEQGICYDEVGQRDAAIVVYERGLRLIDKALHRRQPANELHRKYCTKMEKARAHIESRLRDLKGTKAEQSKDEPYDSISGAIDAFGRSKVADELFLVPQGVQIFFIRGTEASVPSYPTELRVFKFGDWNELSSSNEAPAFLQVGDWIYPLFPDRSPVLKSSYGAYLFPNPSGEGEDSFWYSAPTKNSFVGVVLPQDVDEPTKNGFEELLREHCALRRQTSELREQLTEAEEERLAEKISKFLVSTGEFIAWGLGKTADQTSKLVAKGSEKYREGQQKGVPVAVDPRVKTSVHYLRRGTKVAVKVTGYLLNKIGDAGVYLGKQAATGIEKRAGDKSSTAGTVVHDTLAVLGGGIAGAATVWMGMENAAKSLAKNIANETVVVVDHNYGEEAAVVADDALHAAGFGTMTAWNVKSFGVKAIAKRTAKKAGLAMLADLSKSAKTESEKKTTDEGVKKND